MDPNLDTWTCEEHGKVYQTYGGWRYHVKRYHAGVNPPQSTVTTPSPGPELVYPPMREFPVEPSPPQATGTGVAAPPSAPPGPQRAAPIPAVFDSTGLWEGLGAFLDDTFLKDKATKCNITPAKAAALDSGLKQMGIMVEQSAPVVIPNWAPFLITIIAVFGPPMAYVIKDVVTGAKKKISDMRGPKVPPSPPPADVSVSLGGGQLVPTQSPPPSTQHEPQIYRRPEENG